MYAEIREKMLNKFLHLIYILSNQESMNQLPHFTASSRPT